MPSQRLIVIVDGTWNRADPPPGVRRTNAARIAQLIPPVDRDGLRQTLFYLEGIGTRGKADRFLKAYTAHGIRRLIRDVYLFLAHNWRSGDEVHFIGVSRGAFILRRVSEWIDERGLLRPQELSGLEADWEALRDRAPAAPKAREVAIRFFGAFDMVDALGVPLPGFRGWTRPHVGVREPLLPVNVQTARHALAADEDRDAFQATIWKTSPGAGRDLRQLWFPGAHGDVCGGFGKNELADLSLEWMVGEARDAGMEIADPRLSPDLAADPTPPRGIHRLLPVVPRRPLETSSPTEALHPSFIEKAKMEDYARGPVVVRLKQKGALP